MKKLVVHKRLEKPPYILMSKCGSWTVSTFQLTDDWDLVTCKWCLKKRPKGEQ